MRSEQSWSLLDPRPVLLYLEKHDEYIVYWNGVAMTHPMAMCMAMEHFGIWATPEMKSAMEKNYERIYYANGFNTRAWDLKVIDGGVYPFLKRIMKDHLKKTVVDKAVEAKDVLAWFDYRKARSDGQSS